MTLICNYQLFRLHFHSNIIQITFQIIICTYINHFFCNPSQCWEFFSILESYLYVPLTTVGGQVVWGLRGGGPFFGTLYGESRSLFFVILASARNYFQFCNPTLLCTFQKVIIGTNNCSRDQNINTCQSRDQNLDSCESREQNINSRQSRDQLRWQNQKRIFEKLPATEIQIKLR